MTLRLTTLIFLLVLFTFHVASARETTRLKLASLQWPPYCGQQLHKQGYASEVVRAALHHSGYQANLHFFPWERTIRTGQQSDFAGYTPEYKSEELTDCLLSEPFPSGPLYFFKRKDADINYAALTDLKNQRIGIVSGYVNSPEFDNAHYLQKHPAVDDETNLRKLLAGRLDLLVGDKLVINYLMKHELKQSPDLIEALAPPLAHKTLHICFNRNNPKANEYAEAFNNGLLQMQKNGTLETMYQNLYDTFLPEK